MIFIFLWVCGGGALSTKLCSIRAPGGRSKGRDGGRGGGGGGMGAFFFHLASFMYLFRLEKRAGLEGVRPGIRARIHQCREKKSYINIYYVDKSIDKSSLARALSLSLCVSLSLFFFPPRTPNLTEQPHIFLPPGTYRHPSHLPGWGWERSGGAGGPRDGE